MQWLVGLRALEHLCVREVEGSLEILDEVFQAPVFPQLRRLTFMSHASRWAAGQEELTRRFVLHVLRGTTHDKVQLCASHCPCADGAQVWARVTFAAMQRCPGRVQTVTVQASVQEGLRELSQLAELGVREVIFEHHGQFAPVLVRDLPHKLATVRVHVPEGSVFPRRAVAYLRVSDRVVFVFAGEPSDDCAAVTWSGFHVVRSRRHGHVEWEVQTAE